MRRRSLLATLGAGLTATAAGCGGSDGNSSPTSASGRGGGTTTPRQSPTPDGQQEDQDPAVEVDNLVVRKSVIYEASMGSGGVLAADGSQYVVGTVGGDAAPADLEFVFETDDQTISSGIDALDGDNTRSVANRRPFVAFELPSPLSASDPVIRERTTGLEWTLNPGIEDVLDDPNPQFELDELSVPQRVSQSETLTASLTVTNTGDEDARFLAAVYWPTTAIADDDESHIVKARGVDPGATVTRTVDIDTEYTATESSPVTLSVEGLVSASRDVQLTDTVLSE